MQSTDYDRTLQSAAVNLNAMYPLTPADLYMDSVTWNPIPIHTIPVNMDASLGMERPCPAYDELFNSTVTDFTTEFFGQHEELLNYLREHTGLPLKNIWDVGSIYDILYIEESSNKR